MTAIRDNALKQLDAIGFDELKVQLSETVHTAFRKGADCPQATVAWTAIRSMPREQWDSAIDWMIYALRVSTDREKKQ